MVYQKHVVCCTAMALGLGIAAATRAQDYPSRPVNIVIGYAPVNSVAELTADMKKKGTRKTLNNVGTEPFPGNAQFLSQLQARELEKWGRLLKLAKIEAE